jgi:DNA-directed RNA polymerase subunit RPC12/RpoP
MRAEPSTLHCPECSSELLVISARGLSCARCGALVTSAEGAGVQARAERAGQRMRDRLRAKLKVG